MKYYIANFGVQNYFWKDCLSRSVISTFEMEHMLPFWRANDRSGYVKRAIATLKTRAGLIPTEQVASRWFNVASTVNDTSGDIWIHRDGDDLWWTVSRPDAAVIELETIKFPGTAVNENIWVFRKPAEKWSNKNKKGARLSWSALHPKACDFLFTQGTLQSLSDDHAKYVEALIEGVDLSQWHNRPEWKEKVKSRRRSEGVMIEAKRNAAYRMAYTAFSTAASSNGQKVSTTRKNKEIGFSTPFELEEYILKLIEMQEGLCALSGLRLQYDGDIDDLELRCSLDRIDSNGHYVDGNLQVVCWFINRWKSDSGDDEFRRLLSIVRNTC